MRYTKRKTTRLAKRFAAEYAAGEYDSFNEADTVDKLVSPFLKSFGWDKEASFKPYLPEIGAYPDVVLSLDGTQRVAIEIKRVNTELSEHIPQLSKYFNGSNVDIGILTNGIEYRFFSWLDEKHAMDSRPYAVVDIGNLDLKKRDAFLNYFYYNSFNTKFFKWFSTADHYSKRIFGLMGAEIATDKAKHKLAKKVFVSRFADFPSPIDSEASAGKKLTKKQVLALYDFTQNHSRWKYSEARKEKADNITEE